MSKVKIPNLLKVYSKANYVSQQRVKFQFYLCIALIITLLLLISLRLHFTPLSNTKDPTHFTNLLPLVIVFLLFIFYLFLLIKGYSKASSVLIPVTILSAVWFVMIFHENQFIARLNTIVYVFMALSMLPLLIHKRNHIILLAAAANIIILIGYTVFIKDKLNLSRVDFWDYIIDNSVAIAFVGLVGFYMNRIYASAIEQAQSDLQKRIETEESLVESEKKYREITESLPQIIFEIELNGKVNYINQIGLEKFRYSPDDISENLFVADFVVEKETLLQTIEKNLKGEIDSYRYTALRKDKSTFPIQVYSILIRKNGNPIGLRGIAIDLIDELKAQKIIQESEERFSVFFRSSPTPFVISEIETGKIFDVNDKWVEMLGYSYNEQLGKTSKELGIFARNEDRENLINKLKTEGFLKNEQVNFITKSGDRIIAKWSAETITLKGEKVLLSLITDETEKIKAEEALITSERKLKETLLLLPQTVYEADLAGKLTYINKAGSDMFGFMQEDIVCGLNVLDTIDPVDHKNVKENISRLLKGDITRGSQYMGKRKDGSTFPMQIYSRPIIENGKARGFRGVIFDLTQIKKVENELRQSNELFRTLIEATPIPTTISDMNGRFLMVNKAFCDDLGINPEDAIGKTIVDLGVLIDKDKESIIVDILNEQGFVENFEISTTIKNGIKHDLYVSAALVTIDNQKVMLRSTVNVTEKKKLENQLKVYNQQLEMIVKERTEELEASNEELRATNEELYTQREHLSSTLEKLKETQEQLIQTEKMASLGLLTAGVAHEINNPINYIYNGAMAIENFLVDNSPEKMEALKPLFEAINTGIQRITGIVKSLNKYSRKDETSPVTCNVHEIIDNALVMLYNQHKKRIEITKEYTKISPVILAKEGELYQVFLNIIINAIHAIEDKGTIKIKTKVAENAIEISIKDTGVGISPEDQKKIFDPFFTTKDPGKGTGLGLSITKKIIQGHKGTINCFSEPDRGTEFVVTLPQILEV